MATVAPSAARRFAIAAPIPRDPPVTSATLPASPLSCIVAHVFPFHYLHCCLSRILRKTCSEHWSFTLRLFFGHFILNDIPMLDQKAVLDANNVRGSPIHRSTEVAKSPVSDHEVTSGDNRSRFVPQRGWKALDELEESFSAGFNVSAVLDVVRGPISFSRYVVTLIEQRVESFKDKRFIFRFGCLTHFYSPCSLRKVFLAGPEITVQFCHRLLR